MPRHPDIFSPLKILIAKNCTSKTISCYEMKRIYECVLKIELYIYGYEFYLQFVGKNTIKLSFSCCNATNSSKTCPRLRCRPFSFFRLVDKCSETLPFEDGM